MTAKLPHLDGPAIAWATSSTARRAPRLACSTNACDNGQVTGSGRTTIEHEVPFDTAVTGRYSFGQPGPEHTRGDIAPTLPPVSFE